MKPRHSWIVIHTVDRVGKQVPAVSVPPNYKPRHNDNLSAFCGLDCELLIDDETRYGLVRDLTAQILDANPRALWVMTCGQREKYILLKKAGHHGTL